MRDENQTLQNALFNPDISQGLTNEKWLHLVASKWKGKKKKKNSSFPIQFAAGHHGESRRRDPWMETRLGRVWPWAHFPTVGLFILLHSDLKQEDKDSVRLFPSKWKLSRHCCVCWVAPWHCPHWSAFNKDDLIRLAPGTHLNLRPCRYYQNIFACEPRMFLAGLFWDRKGWYWRMAGDHLLSQSPEDQIGAHSLKFPKEEAGLGMRESAPLEHVCQTSISHLWKWGDQMNPKTFWPSRSAVLKGDYSHFSIFQENLFFCGSLVENV